MYTDDEVIDKMKTLLLKSFIICIIFSIFLFFVEKYDRKIKIENAQQQVAAFAQTYYHTSEIRIEKEGDNLNYVWFSFPVGNRHHWVFYSVSENTLFERINFNIIQSQENHQRR